MAEAGIDYEELPRLIKDNLTPEQWRLAERELVDEGALVPESGDYINVKNGQIHTLTAGQRASGPLLAVYNLSGGHGRDDTQFHTAPPGAVPPRG
jgi:hypothetical protein